MVIGFVISFCFFWQMLMESSTFIGFTDGASRHTQHSASAAWVIYTPMGPGIVFRRSMFTAIFKKCC